MSPVLTRARQMLAQLGQSVTAIADSLDDAFDRAANLIAASDQPLIITGLGKSGLIAAKVAATMTSTGTPTLFIHPVEALHGDIGVVKPGAILLALSKSGNNSELLDFARQFHKITGGQVISMCHSAHSQLSEAADIALILPLLPELDDFNVAPTTSTLQTLALCDVLAMTVQRLKGFSDRDFARFHPSGALGKRLLLTAADLMVSGGQIPKVLPQSSFDQVLQEMTQKGLGLVCLTDSNETFLGVITDGDLRRLLLRHEPVQALNAGECLERSRRSPDEVTVERSTVSAEDLAIDCLHLMQERKITAIVITRDDRLQGVLRLQDLIDSGI